MNGLSVIINVFAADMAANNVILVILVLQVEDILLQMYLVYTVVIRVELYIFHNELV